MTMRRRKRPSVVVYECSTGLPEGLTWDDVIDGSIELLSEEDRADTERMLADLKARGEPIVRWKLGGEPPEDA